MIKDGGDFRRECARMYLGIRAAVSVCGNSGI